MYIERKTSISEELAKKSVLLLGPRRTGKSTLIRHEIKADKVYNLLLSDTFSRLSYRPSLIREELTKSDQLVVIDEIQKLPLLMDEVHYLIEERGIRFLLTGSSARKLKRTHTSLMGGRLRTRYLFPFVFSEIASSKNRGLNLNYILTHGLLPPVHLLEDPWEELKDYVGSYLEEEILAEALTRKIDHFSRFLHSAALSNGELINFESIARDAQVPGRTVRGYYSILENTLIGNMLSPLKMSGKRKVISTGKFYFFDIGVVHAIIGQKQIAEETSLFGRAFEHFIYLELKAYLHYRGKDHPFHFWRTQSGAEVDFIVGNKGSRIAIEVKASKCVHAKHLKGLRAFSEEEQPVTSIVVSRDPEQRRIGEIIVYPFEDFLSALWKDEII